MNRKRVISICLGMIFCLCVVANASAQPVKLSIFNFVSSSLDASGYGTTVSNFLSDSLRNYTAICLLDKKELETFLSMNELQQNDDPENAILIGTRLALDVVVMGRIEKTGQILSVRCKVVHVGQKKIILDTTLTLLGETGLETESKKLAESVSAVIAKVNNEILESERADTAPFDIETRPGNMSIHLTWHNAPTFRAAGYKIYRATSDSGPFTSITQVDGLEYLDKGLEKKTSYFYKIRGYNKTGAQSQFSKIVKAVTVPAPNKPIILKIEGGVKIMRLVWAPSPQHSDDPFPIVAYRIYRSDSETGPYKEIKTLKDSDLGKSSLDDLFKVDYVDGMLGDGKTYFYRLTALNEKGIESEFSVPVPGKTIPVLSTVFAAGDMIREIHLKWDPVSPLINGYYIYRSTEESGGFKRISKIEAPKGNVQITFKDTEGLGDNTRYFYQVTAYEQPELETSPSLTVSAVTRGKPPRPEKLAAISGQTGKIQLSWNANAQEEVEGYCLYRAKDAGSGPGKFELIKKIEGRNNKTFTDPERKSDFSFTGDRKLEDNTRYHYYLTTFNRVGLESNSSETISALTKSRPQSPSGLKINSGEGRIEITWKTNKEPDIVSYVVYEKDSAGLHKLQSIRDNKFTDTETAKGKQKIYVVTAVDKDDLESEPSLELSIVIK